MLEDLDLIDYSGRSLLTYFSKMIYRGDGTIDSRTTKIHAQRRLGHNFGSLGNVMHSCCEVGERLLKTEAKKISRTAQQRGSTVFERQTCTRILDRHLLEKMRLVIDSRVDNGDNNHVGVRNVEKKDSFSRQEPHFVIVRANSQIVACDRKGKRYDPDRTSGNLNTTVVEKLLEVEPDLQEIQVFNEVILRDGSYVRAFPNYRGEGPWYDFANIQWEDESGAPYFLPAQCLAFYKRNDECMALILYSRLIWRRQVKSVVVGIPS